MNTTLYLGPPGTGKTTKLLSIIEDSIKAGIPPGRIGYISFTKAAIDEAIERIQRPKEEVDYFRTIHSMCFRLKGFSTSTVMDKEHYADLSDRIGVELSGKAYDKSSFDELPDGDKALSLIDLAKLKRQSLREMWEKLDGDLCLDWGLVDIINRSLKRYKEVNFMVDYTDMLEQYLVDGSLPDIDILIVDEAQDLSKLQWEVVNKLATNCQQLILAGDDDQAIYHWAGVDVSDIITVSKKADRVEVLSKSWRLPKKIHALSKDIIGRVTSRIDKQYSPKEVDGQIDSLVSLEEADLSSGKWLCLVRNRYMTTAIIDLCMREGFVYECFNDSPAKWPSVKAAYCWENLKKDRGQTAKDVKAMLRLSSLSGDKTSLGLLLGRNEDLITRKQLHTCKIEMTVPWFEALDKVRADEAEYIRATLRRGEKLNDKPRVRISTIHGAKGSEEENVLLMTDQSYKTWNGSRENHDDEDRVFYVGATRSKNRLCIVEPQTQYYYSI